MVQMYAASSMSITKKVEKNFVTISKSPCTMTSNYAENAVA